MSKTKITIYSKDYNILVDLALKEFPLSGWNVIKPITLVFNWAKLSPRYRIVLEEKTEEEKIKYKESLSKKVEVINKPKN